MGVGQPESISECGGYAASLLPNQLPINTRSVWPTDDGLTSRVPVLQRGDLHGISGPLDLASSSPTTVSIWGSEPVNKRTHSHFASLILPLPFK